MKKPDSQSEFSEKMYEILITHELLEKYIKSGKKVQLYSPSQREEKNKGYDAVFGRNKSMLYEAYQFKIANYKYKRGSKKFGAFPGDIKIKVYKSDNKLDPYHQHNTIVELNDQKKLKVFYCAPNFMSVKELQKFSKKKTIEENSIKVIPHKDLIVDDDNHFYIFSQATGSSTLHSDSMFLPNPIIVSKTNDLNSDIVSSITKKDFKMLLEKYPDSLEGIIFFFFK